MISIISGLALTGAGGTALWYCLPREGRPSPIANIPLLDTVVPIGIVSMVAIGIAMFISGFF